MSVDQEFIEKYEELLSKYEEQDGLLREANTSLENLKWGFKKRETVLLGQVEQYKVMAVKLYESNIKLRDNLRVVCENLCEELETAEQKAEQPETTERALEDQDTVTPTKKKWSRGTVLSPTDQTAVIESMKRRIVELETALNQQLLVPKSTPVKSTPTPRSTPNRSTAIYGGGLMGGTKKGSGNPVLSPHTLPPAGLTTAQLGAVQRSSFSTSSSNLRSPPVTKSPTRSAKTSNKNNDQDQTAAISELFAVEKEQWQQKEQQLTEQVSVLQEELRTLQRAKIAAERQLIHYLRESRRGELGMAHSPSNTHHPSNLVYATYLTSSSPDPHKPLEPTTDIINPTNEPLQSMPSLQLSNGEVEFLKDSLLQSFVEKNSLEKKLGLLQEYVTVLRQRLKVMDDFAQNIDAVQGGGDLKPRFMFPEGFLSSQGGLDNDQGQEKGSVGLLEKGWNEGLGLGLGSGQESAITAAMMNVPTTLEYADTLSIQHLHALFDRRMALKKGSEGTSPGAGAVAGSKTYQSISPIQHTTSSTVAQTVAYEIDETTSLLARHVAALDDIYAKITLPGQSYGQSQSQRQGLVLGTGQGQGNGQGLVTTQNYEFESRMTNNHKTLSEFPRQRLHMDNDDNNNAVKINNSNTLTSHRVHNEDDMAVALREQIQALLIQKQRLDRAVADMQTDSITASPCVTVTIPSSSSSTSSPHVNHLANVLQHTRATIAASVVVNTHQQDQQEMALLSRLQQEYQEYHHHHNNKQPVTR